MRVLWVATKAPVPPVDGGRLVALYTLEALASFADVTVAAPVGPEDDPARLAAELEAFCRPLLVRVPRRGTVGPALRSVLGPEPFAIARHTTPELTEAVRDVLAAERFDVVHAEQVHAFSQTVPALAAGIPVVLRAQNVESDLWRATSQLRPWAGPLLAREARRLARHEGRTVGRAALTVTLTERDAVRLRELSRGEGGAGRVVTVPPPFPAELPPAGAPLAGRPAVVLLGSGGWLPNRDATLWFLEQIWPVVRERLPGARLHLFADRDGRPAGFPPGVQPHAPPADSREVFAPGSVLAVPLRVGSGIRMKILEAWARGVPVVASPEAAAGLATRDGRELLLATSPGGWAEAFARLEPEGDTPRALAAAGRRALRDRHDPGAAAAALADVYSAASGRVAEPSSAAGSHAASSPSKP
jgi:polysaccharide biosynthesis protein PslH